MRGVHQQSDRDGKVFGCSDDSANIDGIFVVLASCEEDEAATEGLLPINKPTTEQSIDLNNRSIELRNTLRVDEG